MYIGCFIENGKPSRNYSSIFFDNSPHKCLIYCQKYDQEYASLFNRTICLCDYFFKKSLIKADENECNNTCPGDASNSCGNSDSIDARLSVYVTSAGPINQKKQLLICLPLLLLGFFE